MSWCRKCDAEKYDQNGFSVSLETPRMPYRRWVNQRPTLSVSISKDLSCSSLKLRCLFATGICLLVIIYYVDSTDWIHPLFIHQQNDTLAEASVSNVSVYNYTCGRAGAARGPHQKVIGFTIYGDFSQINIVRKYLLPLRETIKTIPSIYPDWIVRIHHNLTKDDHDNSTWTLFQNILEFGSHVDLCNVTEIAEQLQNNDISAATWRWLPLLDDMVDTFMSRDSDSLIVVPREQDAVNQWLESDEIFHIMKDHPAHCTVLMLAGMWGVKVSEDRPRIVNAFKSMFAVNYGTNYGYDQYLLADYIWPIAKKSVMAHDSYCCQNFNLSRPFPSKRGENMLFIGGRGRPDERLSQPCPEACRPANMTPEWTFC